MPACNRLVQVRPQFLYAASLHQGHTALRVLRLLLPLKALTEKRVSLLLCLLNLQAQLRILLLKSRLCLSNLNFSLTFEGFNFTLEVANCSLVSFVGLL